MTKTTVLISLEDIAYLAGYADSVDDRRQLDLILRSLDISKPDDEETDDVEA